MHVHPSGFLAVSIAAKCIPGLAMDVHNVFFHAQGKDPNYAAFASSDLTKQWFPIELRVLSQPSQAAVLPRWRNW